MKYQVQRDFGVDVAGRHYAHGEVLDAETVELVVPETVPEEHRERYRAGVGRSAATEIESHSKEGFIVALEAPAAPTAKATASASKEGK